MEKKGNNNFIVLMLEVIFNYIIFSVLEVILNHIVLIFYTHKLLLSL